MFKLHTLNEAHNEQYGILDAIFNYNIAVFVMFDLHEKHLYLIDQILIHVSTEIYQPTHRRFSLIVYTCVTPVPM